MIVRRSRVVPYLLSLSMVMLSLAVMPDPAAAQPRAAHKSTPSATEAPVPGRGAPKVVRHTDPDKPAPPLSAPVFPAARSETVAVPAAGASPVRLAGLPVTVAAPSTAPSQAAPSQAAPSPAAPSPAAPGTSGAPAVGGAPSRVTVRNLDRATATKLSSASAMALLVQRMDGGLSTGQVRLAVDYASFADATGGNYAQRLRLVRLPAVCATVPADPSCANGTPVMADNNVTTTTLTATVDASAGGDVYALDAGTSSDAGDYKATDLSVAGKWTAGTPGGSFTYSYPFDLPDPPYGDAPDLSLDYDSGVVDGRTSASNTQASWVGQGWNINVMYIERTYKPCSEDGYPSYGDLCWSSPYSGDPTGAAYTISIDGHTSELIKAADGSYRMRDDQSYRIDHHTGGPNGDNDGEYWTVSTLDGTQYYLGYGQDQRKSVPTPTNSNWTVPVVSDDSGEPCHQTNLASCQQTYRWNVDEVHSPNEVYQVYYYDTDTNVYKRASSGNLLTYVRAGYLSKIEYGKVWAADAPAPAYVSFTHYNRCTQRTTVDDPDVTAEPTCPTQASSPSSYPDVPANLLCSSSCSHNSPTFFGSDMLDSVQAFVQNTSGGYTEVTKWQLKHSFPSTGDASKASLWLDYVREIGYAGDGGKISDAVTSFDGTNFDNRVDWNLAVGVLKLPMRRLTAIHNSYGGETDVVYGHQAGHGCYTGGLSGSGWSSWYNTKQGHWDSNYDECFPEYFKPDGESAGFGIFHKYVVLSVTDKDHVGGQPSRVTSYSYGSSAAGVAGGAAWHHDDGLLTPDTQQSYGDWRGYSQVQETQGSATNAEKTVTTTTYFRGLDQDVKEDGTTPTVQVQAWNNVKYTDSHFLQGKQMQEQDYRLNADNSTTELSSQLWTYVDLGLTANGPGLHNAHIVRTASHLTRSLRDDGTFRVAETDDTYDTTYGLVTVQTDKGDIGLSTDDTCTTTTYARNTDGWRWMIDYPETVEKHQGSCTGTVIDRTVTLYDGATSTDDTVNKPLDGNATEVRSYVNDTTYSTVDTVYDDEGRVTSRTDPMQHTTTTVYDPATGYPTNGVTVTNPLAQKMTTWTSPAFGEATMVSDPNGNVTETDYDSLGRVSKVWLPTEPRTGGTPSYTYTYVTPASGITAPTGPTVITTKQLQSGTGSSAVWLTGYEFDDGFAEPIETQTASPQTGGREVTVTRYDSRGLTALTSDPFYSDGAAGSGLLNPAETVIPTYTATTYDSLEQKSVEIDKSKSGEVSRTTTADHGDHTVTVPPTGGQIVTWTDVFAKTTKTQDYLDATNHQDTTYTYTPDHQNLATVTDPNGDVTSYTYDWLGHKLTADDPDSGHAVTVYDLAGNIASATDGKNQKISTGYDAAGRPTSTWSGDIGTGSQLSALSYDTAPGGIGQPAIATEYSGGRTYTNAVTSYDHRGRPLGRVYTIPSAESGLGNSYEFDYGYDAADHQTSITYPAAGGLAKETVTENYSTLGLPDTLVGAATYVTGTSFGGDGKLASRSYSANISRQYTYEATTGLLYTITTTVNGATAQDDQYGYNQSGNVTSVADHVAGQNQCFTYDGRARLTAAYTNTTDCSHPADTGGPVPYNLGYGYDGAGNITSSTTDGVTTPYTYPAQGSTAVRPHAVTAVGANAYGYDANGDLTSRTVGGVGTTLTWNPQHRLATATSGTTTDSFVYDTDGTRLLRRDGTTTTLFLDNTELTSINGAPPTATRYYQATGATVAERTPTALTWLTADGQGSADLAISAAGTVARQRYLPYGGLRGGTDEIPGDRGFLGKVTDPTTNLDLLGARYYDPSIGRFASPDPLDNNAQPSTANPFAYAADNPTTFSDPTGLKPADCNAKCMRNWEREQSARARTYHNGRYHYHTPPVHHAHRHASRQSNNKRLAAWLGGMSNLIGLMGIVLDQTGSGDIGLNILKSLELGATRAKEVGRVRSNPTMLEMLAKESSEMKGLPVIGWGLIILAAVDNFTSYMAGGDSPGKAATKTAAVTGAGVGAVWAGAEVGAIWGGIEMGGETGGVIGSFVGPEGTVGGAILGGFVGGVVSTIAQNKIADVAGRAYDGLLHPGPSRTDDRTVIR